jgi:hypothetical protein
MGEIASIANNAALVLNHRGAGIRTRDLLLPKQARYRTAPHPAVILLQQLNCVYTLLQNLVASPFHVIHITADIRCP